ncbi:MAG: beta-ketoacyl synthase N-terminal-like domain-containing protein [Maribacter sp.]
MLKEKVSITGLASISPLGHSLEGIWKAYQNEDHCFSKMHSCGEEVWVAQFSDRSREEIARIKNSDNQYKRLDATVLFALYAARKAMEASGWKTGDNFGINIGSSRGATALFEQYHKEFLSSGKASTLSSPTTTLGNISSWVAHDLGTKGPNISHSITCSTGLHSVLNGIAWITSGMADKFLVGGSEAPLTDFTIAQMKALKIYAKVTGPIDSAEDKLIQSVAEPFDAAQYRLRRSYPCQALNLNKTENTMILGEGAAVVCLEKGIADNALGVIEGVGYATEPLVHNTSISTDAICFQKSMKMALGGLEPSEIDVIVMHAPGTLKGDSSEFRAIQKIFGDKTPLLTTNKWKLGHTFAASGMFNLELALLMLKYNKVITVPYLKNDSVQKEVKKILVNAVGFGGNAVSILVAKN